MSEKPTVTVRLGGSKALTKPVVFTVTRDCTVSELKQRVFEEGHSRYPADEQMFYVKDDDTELPNGTTMQSLLPPSVAGVALSIVSLRVEPSQGMTLLQELEITKRDLFDGVDMDDAKDEDDAAAIFRGRAVSDALDDEAAAKMVRFDSVTDRSGAHLSDESSEEFNSLVILDEPVEDCYEEDDTPGFQLIYRHGEEMDSDDDDDSRPKVGATRLRMGSMVSGVSVPFEDEAEMDERYAKMQLPPLIVTDHSSYMMQMAIKTAKTLHSYFVESICLEDERLSAELADTMLEHFHLFGGCVRDLVLGADIRDMDTNVDTHELCKLQLNHLLEYHSTAAQQCDERKSQCFLWRLYLNNVNAAVRAENEELLASIKSEFKEDSDTTVKQSFLYASACNYVPNARFWAKLLTTLEPFTSNRASFKLKKHRIECWNVYALEAVGTGPIVCEGVDYSGFTLNIGDPLMNCWKMSRSVHSKSTLPMAEDSEEEDEEEDTGDAVAEDCESSSKELISIEVPICELRLRDGFEAMDLTVNMLSLPMATLSQLSGADALDVAMIRNVLNGTEAMDDVRDKVLRAGPSLKTVLQLHSPVTHWWQVVDAKIQLTDFAIDDRLLQVHSDCYEHWLAKDDYFELDSALKDWIYGLHSVLRKPKRSTVEAFVAAMDAMHCTELLASASRRSRKFRGAILREFFMKTKFEDVFVRDDCLTTLCGAGFALRGEMDVKKKRKRTVVKTPR